ncbi:MAG: YeeE/YedE family protein [Verrucomicrobiales bacterium]|nr:YeeE/YedE family protein [Verrucomicrobiales bacterium]
MVLTGKIPGISGIFAKVLKPVSGDFAWRVVFLIGLVVTAGLFIFLREPAPPFEIPGGRKAWLFGIAGLLVGVGTRIGGGCTSGHGVCGTAAGARDSIVATLVFMAAAAATVFAWNTLFAS